MDHTERQRELYTKIWRDDPEYGTATVDVENTVEQRIGPHIDHVYKDHHPSVVDFGAGDGRFLNELHWGVFAAQCVGIDLHQPEVVPGHTTWVQSTLWAPIAVRADFAISTDTLEHMPPEHVDEVLRNISRAAPHGFLRISLRPDTYGTERGLDLHESLFDSGEWLCRIVEAGIDPMSYRIYLVDGDEAALEVYY